MSQTIDLDAYFQRLGHMGPRAATLDALRDIVRRHAETIPFENLNPLLGWPVPLDVAALGRKLIEERRSGYGLEQNWSPANLRRTLERDFLLAVPDTPELDAAFEGLPR
jgi:N-hydroxyarylamine O-acetyltransferase